MGTINIQKTKLLIRLIPKKEFRGFFPEALRKNQKCRHCILH